jgi:hypothetical protein
MARTRLFRPPALCDECLQRPEVGETLWHSGIVWLCPSCLTKRAPGDTTTSKIAKQSLESGQQRSLSKRAKAAGEIEDAVSHSNLASWHGQAVRSLRSEGERQRRSVAVLNGEVVPSEGSWLKDTLANPDLQSIDASLSRTRMLEVNDVTALALDASNTVQADNSVEKMLAHQIALAHKTAFEQASKAQIERDPKVELKRLQISARMMTTSQDAALALQKLKTGGTQNVVVQHVNVNAGGQAVVGNVDARRLVT